MRTVVWAAGVAASAAGKWLGAETDRAGRVRVLPDLTVPGSPEIFVIGDLATVGRSFAVADLGRITLSGWIAWCAWIVVHVYYLIGFRNRVAVLLEWAWAYVTFQRGARLITRED